MLVFNLAIYPEKTSCSIQCVLLVEKQVFKSAPIHTLEQADP